MAERITDQPIASAVADVQLGASLADVWRACLARLLAVPADDRLEAEISRLSAPYRRELQAQATRFTGAVCRWLGERFARDARICRVLEEWVRQSGDYDAYDALLGNFDFPARPRLLAEARRKFPRTLTAHWD
jgi:hypothetical protein